MPAGWDAFTRPRALLEGTLTALGEPGALAFSAGFGLLVAAGYLLLFPSCARPRPHPPDAPECRRDPAR